VQPLIVTLALEQQAQERFDRLRRAHFPPERNHLSAHVTLFHALPGEHEEQVRLDLAEQAQRAPFPLRVSGLRSRASSSAARTYATPRPRLRERLRQRWEPWLTPQDRQRHSPHVTVQNKVAPERARALLEQLQAGFEPYDVGAQALALWRYLGGPWEPLGAYPFAGSSTG
jgi:2'-5' RNA ligase